MSFFNRRKFSRFRKLLYEAWQRLCAPRFLSSLALLCIFLACIALLALLPHYWDASEIEGNLVLQNIYAKNDCTVVDSAMTQQAKERAEKESPLYYRMDTAARDRVARNLDAFYEEFRSRVQADEGNRIYDGTGKGTAGKAVSNLSKEALRAFRNVDSTLRFPDFLKNWKNIVDHGILNDNEQMEMEKRIVVYSDKWTRLIPEKQVIQYRLSGVGSRMADDVCFGQSVDDEARKNIADSLLMLIEPNLSYDDKKTHEVCEENRNNAEITRFIIKGQLLFRKGTRLTEEQKNIYQEYVEQTTPAQSGFGGRLKVFRQSFMILFLFVFISIYIYHIYPDVARSRGSIWELGGITVLSLVVNRIMAGLFSGIALSHDIPQIFFFLSMPLALPTLLISVTYGLRTGIYVGLFTSGIIASAMNFSFPVFITGILACGFSGLAVRYVTDYKKFFFRAFALCFLTSFASCAIFTSDIIRGNFSSEPVLTEGQSAAAASAAENTETGPVSAVEDNAGRIFGIRVLPERIAHAVYRTAGGMILIPFGGAILTAMCALLILFMIESNMSFLAFTDRNHELLKRLSIEAPGTFQHSVRVAELAERAADAIGLLPTIRIQACALFHDIGKLKYPRMFTENVPGQRPLEGLEPLDAVKVLRSHVEFGLELAKRYKLPPLIQEAIRTHHGTTHVSYFYDQLKKENAPNLVEADYCYSGPKPEKREVALLMLADSCEAAVSSLKEHDNEQVAAMIEKVIESKISQSQLGDANLTTKELETIRRMFFEVFTKEDGTTRLAYPDLIGKDRKA